MVFDMGFLCCNMIGAPHPLHTHRRSISYIYNVFQHLTLWLLFIRMQPQPDICSLRVEKEQEEIMLVFDMGFLCCNMIGAPPLHTHSRSISYIYNVFHHLTLWLLFIRMQPQPDICSLRVEKEQLEILFVFDMVFLCCNMIGTPHPCCAHSRSISYVYNVFQHLLLWFGVIRMQPQPDIYSHSWACSRRFCMFLT